MEVAVEGGSEEEKLQGGGQVEETMVCPDREAGATCAVGAPQVCQQG